MTETLASVKALTCDVFGTIVDWRSSVNDELLALSQRTINADTFSESSEDSQAHLRHMTDIDWADFAQEWRASYGKFTRGFKPGVTPWKDIDTHHYDSVVDLLDKWRLPGVFDEKEVKNLSLVWHRLKPWPDSAQGLHLLSERFITATLSNGTRQLLQDLNEYGGLGFSRIVSAEDFKAYKPDPSVYLGAARTLELEPSQVAMIAAHLRDLKAARSHGFRTIYVERPEEEEWAPDSVEYRDARQWVDLWIDHGQHGMEAVAASLAAIAK